jgi:hypothetical protein
MCAAAVVAFSAAWRETRQFTKPAATAAAAAAAVVVVITGTIRKKKKKKKKKSRIGHGGQNSSTYLISPSLQDVLGAASPTPHNSTPTPNNLLIDKRRFYTPLLTRKTAISKIQSKS